MIDTKSKIIREIILQLILSSMFLMVVAQSNLPIVYNENPITLYPNMSEVSGKKNTVLFESKEKIHFSQFINNIKGHEIDTLSFKRVNGFKSNKSNYWMLVPINVASQKSLDVAIQVYGCQNDSIWVLDSNLNVRQSYLIPKYNIKIDLTNKIGLAKLHGIGLKLIANDKYIAINSVNYSYSDNVYPNFFDASLYAQWYYRNYLHNFIFFLFMCGIEVGLILYFILHYILLREKYLLWYILYVLAQMLPNLDYILWSFSEQIPLPYAWISFKVFHLCSIILTYLMFIKNILTEKILIFKITFNLIVPLFIGIFIFDLILLLNGHEYYSGLLYKIGRSIAGPICFIVTSIILYKHPKTEYKLLFIGILSMVTAELIGWFVLPKEKSYIINIGILIEYLFFNYLINTKIKSNENDRLKIKAENEILIQKQMQMKQNIAQDIHDEVGSIITKFNLELHLDKVKAMDDTHISSILRYQQYVSKIRDGIRELIQVMEDKTCQFNDFKIEFKEIAVNYLDSTNIQVHFKLIDDNPHAKISNKIRRNLLFATKEVLQNILKHSKASNVYITLQSHFDTIYLNISDDGIGINQSSNKEGRGLINIYDRINNLNGTIEIISNSSYKNGTTISILIPTETKLNNI